MARGFEYGELSGSQCYFISMAHGMKNIIGFCLSAKIDICSGLTMKFNVPGHKICVKMCEGNVLQDQVMMVEIGQVLLNVSL